MTESFIKSFLYSKLMKQELIIKLFALKKDWKQRELLAEAGCTKGYLSKVIKRLENENSVTKIDRKQIIVIDLPKLLSHWISIRKLAKPHFIDTEESVEKIEQKLKKSNINYSITLFRAAWHRLKLLKVEKIEIYVLEKDLGKVFKLLGKPNAYGKVELYPAEETDISYSEKINGINLVPVVQNYVDLMHAGGNGTRIALELAKRFELFGV